MRTVALVVGALLLAAVASADQTSQAEARAVQDRWGNCSQIVHGRLGALHPANGDLNSNFIMMGGIDIEYPNPADEHGVASVCKTTVNVTYQPCTGTPFLNVTINQPKDTAISCKHVATYIFDTATITDGRLVNFFMPAKQGEVAHFVGDYTAASMNQATAIVVTSCNPANPAYLSFAQANFNGTSPVFNFEFRSIEACARFPYTNEAVPAGGVAAIIIVVIAFILQIGACGYYHKTYSHGSYTTSNYANVE